MARRREGLGYRVACRCTFLRRKDLDQYFLRVRKQHLVLDDLRIQPVALELVVNHLSHAPVAGGARHVRGRRQAAQILSASPRVGKLEVAPLPALLLYITLGAEAQGNSPLVRRGAAGRNSGFWSPMDSTGVPKSDLSRPCREPGTPAHFPLWQEKQRQCCQRQHAISYSARISSFQFPVSSFEVGVFSV